MDDAAPDREAPSLAGDLAGSIRRQWIQRQRDSGSFRDRVIEEYGQRGRDTYGEAMLGSALMLAGERLGDEAASTAGLRAIEMAIKTRRGLAPKRLPQQIARMLPRLKGGMYPFSMVGVFDYLSIDPESISAVGEGRQRLADLSRAEIDRSGPLDTRLIDRKRDLNRMVLELLVLKSLESVRRRPTGDAADPSSGSRELDLRISRWCEASLGTSSRSDPCAVLLSDSPDKPLAYHAFTSGNLARLIRHFRPGQRNRLEELLRRAVRASRGIANPVGDLAWSGRTTMLSWTLAYSAYAALAAANTPDCAEEEAEENRRFAGAQLQRLASAYLTDADGPSSGDLSLVPALTDAPESACEALDPYAAEASYAGTTLLALEWAARESGESPSTPGASSWSLELDGSITEATSLRADQLWVGLRGQRSSERIEPRYDLGAVAAQQLVDGEWRWLLHPRPRLCDLRHRSWLQLLEGADPVLPLGRSLERVGSEVIQAVEFPGAAVDGSIPLVQIESRAAGRGGIEFRIDRASHPLQLVFWLPESPLEHDEGSIRVGEVLLRVSGAPAISTGETVAGSTHPALMPLVFVFEPGEGILELELTISPRYRKR